MSNDPFDLGADTPSLSQRAVETAQASAAQNLTMLDNLNDAQREAVLAEDGALLLLAGAGTGKTRALTTRIAYKIATKQAYPSQFLAVTFTNKAAREMRLRIDTMLGESVEAMPWLGTFHSLSARILRRHAELVGLRSDFTILDMDDQMRLLKQIIKAQNIDEKRWPARQLAGIIDRWKNRGLAPDVIPQSDIGQFAGGQSRDLYEIYQNRLKTLNASDFGDLLMEAVRLFRENNDVLAEYQKKFRHILVDEYQDTNVVQYLWLRLLALEHGNICCVGDDDQSIYGWRGAEIDNILRFEKDFSGARTIRLEQNYRSSPHILAAASGLIAANEGRLGKTLWTQRKDGDKILLRSCWDGEEEARLIGDDIETRQRKKQELNNIAILVRAGFQMREFEDRFIILGLPYRVIGGPRFYERAEIRDANAYLRLINQPQDDLAFERICNRPRRGFGDTSLQALHTIARRDETSLFHAATTALSGDALRPAARRALEGFLAAIERWRTLAEDLPHTDLAELVLEESGYLAMWQADKSPEAPGKLENLKELVRSMQDFENLAGYLEHIALVMEVQNNETDDKVSIMTLHAAKGLEFDIVFLPGWEENLFPHQRSLDESGTSGLEEERRLAYVGITRARQHVSISFAGSRRTHGQWISSTPSRFINELPENHVEVENETQAAPRFNNRTHAAKHTNVSRETWQHQATKTIEGKVEETSTNAFQCGERVFHQKFGYGRVEAVDGNKLTINFDKAARKRVLAEWVEKQPQK